MGWGTIRRATDEDVKGLELTAQRFAARHGIYVDESGATRSVDLWIDRAMRDGEGWTGQNSGRVLGRQWRACVRRCLHSPGADGIEYGYVGYYVK
jgi:hypothetical protein